jgi:hypothetical protein
VAFTSAAHDYGHNWYLADQMYALWGDNTILSNVELLALWDYVKNVEPRYPGTSNFCSTGHTIDYAYIYWKKTGDNAWAAGELAFLVGECDALPIVDGCVFMSDATVFFAQNWTFYDNSKQGDHLLMSSVMLYSSYEKLEEIAIALSDSVTAADCNAKKEILRAGIIARFYVEDIDGAWMRAATGYCSGQWDISGTARAIYCNILDNTRALKLVNRLIAIKDEWLYEGGIRAVPTSYEHDPGVQIWEEMIAIPTAYGWYQNGGYLNTALPWMVGAIKLVDNRLARKIWLNCAKILKEYSYQESWSKDEHYTVSNYSASCGMLLRAYNELV